MIIFVAPNPFKEKEREGYLQRVAAIDNIFGEEEKHYFFDIADSAEAADLLDRARLIYVHSVYESEKALFLYRLYGYKIITDLHGVVPEEEDFAGHAERAIELARVEKTVFENSDKFVSVTHAMARHYQKKYPNSKNHQWITLPIFNDPNLAEVVANGGDTVIYAGGAQPWQNVDLMVNAVNARAESNNFIILTHSPEAFAGISSQALNKTTIKKVNSEEVKDYYKRSSLGFILRDEVVVNTVACPTKLIEYLCYGVVPIVLSPRIGDFMDMGYTYLSYDEFIRNGARSLDISEAIRNNLKVFEKLVQMSKNGAEQLKKVNAQRPEKYSENPSKQMIAELSELSKQCAMLRQSNLENIAQIAEQKRHLSAYALMVGELQKKIDDIEHSIRYKVGSRIAGPVRAVRKLKK